MRTGVGSAKVASAKRTLVTADSSTSKDFMRRFQGGVSASAPMLMPPAITASVEANPSQPQLRGRVGGMKGRVTDCRGGGHGRV